MLRNKVLRGVVHGNVIELEDDAGISDGEQVEVIVRRIAPQRRQSGEGFLAFPRWSWEGPVRS
ncbi:MAG TPA: hypothetical protein VMV10_20160 [Pirellulales bacterium]|nr:hypothetical protein [Pirellulales bacterium]